MKLPHCWCWWRETTIRWTSRVRAKGYVALNNHCVQGKYYFNDKENVLRTCLPASSYKLHLLCSLSKVHSLHSGIDLPAIVDQTHFQTQIILHQFNNNLWGNCFRHPTNQGFRADPMPIHLFSKLDLRHATTDILSEIQRRWAHR